MKSRALNTPLKKEEESFNIPAFRHGEQCTFQSVVKSPLTTSETFRGPQIIQPGGAANFLIILTSGCLA
jgi:hypothetical protein